jgi:DNA-binding transcriptional LysR family regulator
VAVAEELNFTRAAERLNVVQQSLSSAIARLESSLGFKLFERSSRAVTLSERGSQWLPHAREVLAAAERAQTAARDLATGSVGTLRVGLAATAAVELTPAVLRAFAERHPHVRLLTEHYGFEDPPGGLRGHVTDVAIVRPPFDASGLDLIVLASERRYAAVAGEHRLAHRATVRFDDVVDEPWSRSSSPIPCGAPSGASVTAARGRRASGPTAVLWMTFWRPLEPAALSDSSRGRSPTPTSGQASRSSRSPTSRPQTSRSHGVRTAAPRSSTGSSKWPRLWSIVRGWGPRGECRRRPPDGRQRQRIFRTRVSARIGWWTRGCLKFAI